MRPKEFSSHDDNESSKSQIEPEDEPYFYHEGGFVCKRCLPNIYKKDTPDKVKRHLRDKHKQKYERKNKGETKCPISGCPVKKYPSQMAEHIKTHGIDMANKNCRDVRKEYKIVDCIFCPENLPSKDQNEHYRIKHEITEQWDWEKLREEWNDFLKKQSVANLESLDLQKTFLNKKRNILGFVRKPEALKKLLEKKIEVDKKGEFILIDELENFTKEVYEMDTKAHMLILALKHVFDIHQNWKESVFYDILFEILRQVEDLCRFGSKNVFRHAVDQRIQKHNLIKSAKCYASRTYYIDEEKSEPEKGYESTFENRISPSSSLYSFYNEISLNKTYLTWDGFMKDKKNEKMADYQKKVRDKMAQKKKIETIHVKENGMKVLIHPKEYQSLKITEQAKEFGLNPLELSDMWIKTPAETRCFNSIFKPEISKKKDEFDFEAYNMAEERKRMKMLENERDDDSEKNEKEKIDIFQKKMKKMREVKDKEIREVKVKEIREVKVKEKYAMSEFLESLIEKKKTKTISSKNKDIQPKENEEVFIHDIELEQEEVKEKNLESSMEKGKNMEKPELLLQSETNQMEEENPSHFEELEATERKGENPESMEEETQKKVENPEYVEETPKKTQKKETENFEEQIIEEELPVMSPRELSKLRNFPRLSFLSFNPHFLQRILNANNPEDAFIFIQRKLKVKKEINSLTKRPITTITTKIRERNRTKIRTKMRPFSKLTLRKINEIRFAEWQKKDIENEIRASWAPKQKIIEKKK